MQAEGWKLRANHKEMLEIKNAAAKNVFEGFLGKLDMAEERISKTEDNRNFLN